MVGDNRGKLNCHHTMRAFGKLNFGLCKPQQVNWQDYFEGPCERFHVPRSDDSPYVYALSLHSRTIQTTHYSAVLKAQAQAAGNEGGGINAESASSGVPEYSY